MRTALLLCGLGAVGLFGCAESAQPPPQAGGVTAASNRLGSGSLELDGRPFDLWQGRDKSLGTVVVFTRSDCPISNRYAPTVRSLCQAYQGRGIDFYLVYVDPHESAESIRIHQHEYQYECPGIRDPKHELVAACGATVTPEAVVFDAERQIVYRGRIDDIFAGIGQSRTEATTHELADAIEAILSGRAVAQQTTKAVGCYIGDLE